MVSCLECVRLRVSAHDASSITASFKVNPSPTMLSHISEEEPPPKVTKHTRQLTAEQLASEVAGGRALIIVRDAKAGASVYDLTKWIRVHPGGELAIRHFIGGQLIE